MTATCNRVHRQEFERVVRHIGDEIAHAREKAEVESKHARELVDLHNALTTKALELQASNNERHFEALNHEAERILAAQERSVSVERYNADQTALFLWRDEMIAFRANLLGRLTVIGTLIVMATAAATALLTAWVGR